MNPEERKLRAQKAARARWAREQDRTEVVLRLRTALMEKWRDEVDPDRVLPEDVRERLALEAQREHLRRARLARTVQEAQARAAAAPPTDEVGNTA